PTIAMLLPSTLDPPMLVSLGPTQVLDTEEVPSRSEPGPASPPITRLAISCPDRPGIVAATSRFLADTGANIVHSDQHTTGADGGTFFMRMEFELELGERERGELEASFATEVGEPLAMRWRMWDARRPKRVAILVSREDHCL